MKKVFLITLCFALAVAAIRAGLIVYLLHSLFHILKACPLPL